MSEITTEICKDFLVSKFKNSKKSQWVRIRKFKHNDKWCREFKNPAVGTVFLIESLNGLSFIKKDMLNESAITISSQSDFVNKIKITQPIFKEIDRHISLNNFKIKPKTDINKLIEQNPAIYSFFSFEFVEDKNGFIEDYSFNNKYSFIKITSSIDYSLIYSDSESNGLTPKFRLIEDLFVKKNGLYFNDESIDEDIYVYHGMSKKSLFEKLIKLGLKYVNKNNSQFNYNDFDIIDDLQEIKYITDAEKFMYAVNSAPVNFKELLDSGFSTKYKINNSSILSYLFNNDKLEHFKIAVDCIKNIYNDTIIKDMYIYSSQENSKLYFDYLLENSNIDIKKFGYQATYHFVNLICYYNSFEKYKHLVNKKQLSIVCFNMCINNITNYNKLHLQEEADKAFILYSDELSKNDETRLILLDGFIIEPILIKMIEKGDVYISGKPLLTYLESIVTTIKLGFSQFDSVDSEHIKNYYQNYINKIKQKNLIS